MPNQRIDTLIESTIDWTRTRLDPDLFSFDGKSYGLRPDVSDFVKRIISEIDNNIVAVNDAFIKGSILSYQWLDDTDVDILLEIDKVDDEEWRRIQDSIDEAYDGTCIPGTSHPLQIYAHGGTYDHNNADGILYLDDRGWEKGPYNLRVDVRDYMDKFRKIASSIDMTTGELKRSIVDYDILKRLPREDVKNLYGELEITMKNIDKAVDDLTFQYRHIKDMRHAAFDREMMPAEILKYGSKNNLPENVIFKLLERYHYMDVMSKIKELYEDGLQESDIECIKDILKIDNS